MPEERKDETNTLLFTQLIISFQAAALQNLGHSPSPVTGKTEANLELAKNSIDILGMLEDKTSGNLSEDESKLLQQSLTQLRMMYIEAINNPR